MGRFVRRFLLAGLILAALVGVTSLFLMRMASAPPDYYARIIAAEEASDLSTRQEQAKELVGDVLQMRNDIANDPEWTIRLTDEAINAWLAENVLGDLIEDFPAEVSQPRLKFEPERLQIAFRWNGPPVAAVISLSLRPGCSKANELTIGVENLRVGMLPLSGERFRQDVVDHLRSAGIDARWIEQDGFPALAMTIAPSLQSKSIDLERITVLDGEIRISGRSHAEVSVERLGNTTREGGKLRLFR